MMGMRPEVNEDVVKRGVEKTRVGRRHIIAPTEFELGRVGEGKALIAGSLTQRLYEIGPRPLRALRRFGRFAPPTPPHTDRARPATSPRAVAPTAVQSCNMPLPRRRGSDHPPARRSAVTRCPQWRNCRASCGA